MRQTILGLAAVAALAVMGTAPAMACDTCNGAAYSYGYTAPAPVYVAPAPVYVAPAPTYSYPAYSYGTGCGHCGGTYERLAEPTTQYYYANQGPTYSGPGAFAPYPTYREAALPVYHRPYAYGYRTSYYAGAGVSGPAVYGYHHRLHRSYYARPSYGYGYGYHHPHHVARYGYAPYYQGHRVLRRYY